MVIEIKIKLERMMTSRLLGGESLICGKRGGKLIHGNVLREVNFFAFSVLKIVHQAVENGILRLAEINYFFSLKELKTKKSHFLALCSRELVSRLPPAASRELGTPLFPYNNKHTC